MVPPRKIQVAKQLCKVQGPKSKLKKNGAILDGMTWERGL
jgi:hypothetical protein